MTQPDKLFGWQPIETYDKEKSCHWQPVLVYRSTGSTGQQIHVAYYNKPYDGYVFKTDNKWKRVGGGIVNNVTHWMHLPEDPTDPKGI